MRLKRTTGAIAAALLMLAGAATLFGGDDSRVWVATLASVEGTVEVRRKGDEAWKSAAASDRVFEGDTVRVRRMARAALQFRNNATMRLDQETTVTLGEAKTRRSFWAQILTGATYFFSHAPRSLEIRTPFVNGSIEGTEFAVAVGQAESSVAVFDGRVSLSNEHGRVSVGRGEAAVAAAGQGPAIRAQVVPRDMVRWTIFFPPVVAYRSGDFRDSSSEWQNAVRAALARRQAGDVSGALAALPDKTEGITDPRFFVLRAELLMAAGRHAESEPDVSRALSLHAGCADALALQAMGAVIANRREDALTAAAKAVKSDPRSVVARMAQSYAHQASGDIEAALSSAREAAGLDAENGAVRARVAELLLMLGRRQAAVAEARRSVRMDQSSALAHTVMGFAHLANTVRDAAVAEFAKAAALAPGDPQPRLGLGLAKIRGGDLEGGRAELEIAVTLDPSQSLLRSYLGKAYAEENRDNLAGRELDRARALDPNDPTPWFYDAMRKQTINRPGEALADIQEAVERNDNRAVYRSRLLLDRDLAARGVSQARIYEDLGFSHLAFSEACRSVMLDPGNASAHRFLADAYAGMPRSEIARESELLVAQLRQPSGAGLIQPRLGEARPGVLTGLGAVDPAYNEYTRLFERDGLRGMASVFAGNQGSWGEEFIGGGVFGRYAFSAGESRIMSDGWRENADVDERVQNVIGSVAVTPEFTLLGGYRRQDAREGDTELRLFVDDVSGMLRQDTEQETVLLGAHWTLSPNADLVAVGHRQTRERNMTDILAVMMEAEDGSGYLLPTDASLEVATERQVWAWESQCHLKFSNMDWLVGGGRYEEDFVSRDRVRNDMEEDVFPPTVETRKIVHDNMYAYSFLRASASLASVVGVSMDRHDDLATRKNQYNPKFGLLWTPGGETTVRLGGFRTLKRSLVNQQTIEPSEVVGFQQFHDQPDATDAWRYGIALDRKVFRRCFAGAALEQEDADIPFAVEDLDGSRWEEVRRRNRVLRIHGYGLITPRLSFGLELCVSVQDSDMPTAPFAPEMKTCWLPAVLRYHAANGLFGSLRATVVRQSVEVPDVEENLVEYDHKFLTVDAVAGWRLPGRRGVLAVAGRNVFDRSFGYQNAEAVLPRLEPDRCVSVNLTVVF